MSDQSYLRYNFMRRMRRNALSCKKEEICPSSGQVRIEENFALKHNLTSSKKIYKEQGFVLLQASTLEEANYLIEQVT